MKQKDTLEYRAKALEMTVSLISSNKDFSERFLYPPHEYTEYINGQKVSQYRDAEIDDGFFSIADLFYNFIVNDQKTPEDNTQDKEDSLLPG